MPILNMAETGINIKRIIKEKRIKISQLQKILGFNNPQAIYKWFRGESIPTVDNLLVLAYVLDTTIDDLIIAN